MARKVTAKQTNRYEKLIEAVFLSHFKKGLREFEFRRDEIEEHASRLGIQLPKNIGDLIYSFRFRVSLPEAVRRCAPPSHEWVIEGAGRSKYRFVASPQSKHIKPNPQLIEIKVPDSTPGIVAMYAMNDEQALLARIRYNRLIDTFTKATCYSLQNHLRTTVRSMGQIETDELYVGVDRSGSQFVFPVQAKGGKDKLSTIQVRQD